MNILLLGCGGNAGINFTKCLKNYSTHNFTVYGMDTNKYYLYTSNADVLIPSPEFKDSAEKLNFIKSIVLEKNIDFIHAQPDPEVKFLLENKSHFEGKLFNHNIELWNIFSNKLYCQKIWKEKLALNFLAYSFSEIQDKPELFNEVVSISGKAWVRYTEGAGSKAALPVTTLEQAKNWINYWKECRNLEESKFMIAEYLPNKEYAVQTFWHNGECIQIQARIRLIYFFGALMPSGQTSTPAVAVTVDDPNHLVYTIAKKAILSIDEKPHGIYCVDLKESVKNEIVPMEVNYGRFFTTTDFFASLGRNMPEAYVRGLTTPSPPLAERVYWVRGLDKEPKLLKNYQL